MAVTAYFLLAICLALAAAKPLDNPDHFLTNLFYNQARKLAATVEYVNCKPTDKFDNGDVTLDSVVGFATKKIGLTAVTDSDPGKAYVQYVNMLSKKLGGSEPYVRSMKVNNVDDADVLRQEMTKVLPVVTDKFEQAIDTAVAHATGYVETGVDNFNAVFYRKNSKEWEGGEFVVLKVFKSGQNLEIIPSYLHVKGHKTEERIVFGNRAWSDAEITYKEQKFLLSFFDIKTIVKKLEEEAGSKWD